MDSDLTCPQLSPYNFIQHASRGKVGAQCEMGRKKGILSLLPTTSKNAQHRTRWECRVTLHHAVCCMKMTADKSGLRLQIIYFILSLSTWITHLLQCKLTSHLFNLTQGWKLGSSNNLELTNDSERSGIPDSLQHESICVSEEKKNINQHS